MPESPRARREREVEAARAEYLAERDRLAREPERPPLRAASVDEGSIVRDVPASGAGRPRHSRPFLPPGVFSIPTNFPDEAQV